MARVLVIEDDSELLRILTCRFACAGHEVSAALDGGVAQQMMAERTYDLVVTDLIMPEREGIETICEIKKRTPALPVVAISGGSSLPIGPNLLQMARLLGADAVLAKPFRPSELVDLCETLLARSREAPPRAA